MSHGRLANTSCTHRNESCHTHVWVRDGEGLTYCGVDIGCVVWMLVGVELRSVHVGWRGVVYGGC